MLRGRERDGEREGEREGEKDMVDVMQFQRNASAF